MHKVLVNGCPATDISVMDRGFQYGDGLFETMHVVNGKVPLWRAHHQRLAKGCERLSIPLPDICQLTDDLETLCTDHAQAVVKLIITRGVGNRGYAISPGMQAQVVMMLSDYPDFPASHCQQGVALRSCKTRLAQQPALAGIKHLNRLEQVLARQEWRDNTFAEGVMYDQQGNLVECISSNIFMVKEQQLMTPLLDNCGVEGVMRNHIIRLLANENISTAIGTYNKEHLLAADEVFITNSLIGVWPVNKIDSTLYPVGAVTRLIQDKLSLL